MLTMAGLAHKIHHSAARGIPLGAQIKPNMFKTILFDVGIHQRLQRNDISAFLTSPRLNDINKGNIAEAFVGTELIKYAPPAAVPLLFEE